MHGPNATSSWAPVGLLRAMWRYRGLVVVATVVGAVSGYVGSSVFPLRYETTAHLQLDDPEHVGVFGELREGVEGEAYLLAEADRVTSTPVLRDAGERLVPRATVDELRSQVRSTALTDLNTLDVTAEASTPERAAAIADQVAIAYEQASRDQRLQRADVATTALQSYVDELNREIQEIDTGLEERRAVALRQARALPVVEPSVVSQAAEAAQILAGDLEYQSLLLERQALFTQLRSATDKVERIRIDAEVIGSGVRRFDRAEVPAEPAWPPRGLFAAVFGLIGFLGASGLAWKLAEDRAAAERSEDAASSAGVPLLGDIPRFRSPAKLPGLNVTPAVTRARTFAVPYSSAGESFQYTLSSLLAKVPTDGDGRAPVVVVTGTVPGDGGTTTALNLGLAASHRRMRVVMIDADFRRRSLTRICGLTGETGVSESTGDRLIAFDVARQGLLQVAPTGNAYGDAIAYLNSAEFSHAVEIARRRFDLVILDVPPVLTAADALSAAGEADGVVLVIGLGRALDDLREAARLLDQTPAPLVGCVFNRPKRRWIPRARSHR